MTRNRTIELLRKPRASPILVGLLGSAALGSVVAAACTGGEGDHEHLTGALPN